MDPVARKRVARGGGAREGAYVGGEAGSSHIRAGEAPWSTGRAHRGDRGRWEEAPWVGCWRGEKVDMVGGMGRWGLNG